MKDDVPSGNIELFECHITHFLQLRYIDFLHSKAEISSLNGPTKPLLTESK